MSELLSNLQPASLLEERLAIFQAASRDLRSVPLKTPKELARLGVEYQPELVGALEQAIEDCDQDGNKFF